MSEILEQPENAVNVPPTITGKPAELTKKMSRREFLKIASVGAAVALTSGVDITTSRAQEATPTAETEVPRNPDFMLGKIYIGENYTLTIPDILSTEFRLPKEYPAIPLVEDGMPSQENADLFVDGIDNKTGRYRQIIRRSETKGSMVADVHSQTDRYGMLPGTWISEARRNYNEPGKFVDDAGEPLVFELRQGEDVEHARVVDFRSIPEPQFAQAYQLGPENNQYHVNRAALGMPEDVLGPNQLTLTTCTGVYNEATGLWSHIAILTLELMDGQENAPANNPSPAGK